MDPQAHIANNIFYIAGVGRNSSGEKRKPINDGTHISQPASAEPRRSCLSEMYSTGISKVSRRPGRKC